MDNVMIRLLERSKIKQELLAFWQYSNTNNFWCGYVIDYNETVVSIQHYTKYGLKDGILIWPIDKIQNIDFQNDYIRCLQHTIERNSDRYESHLNLTLPNHDEWQFDLLVQLEGNPGFVSSIEIGGGSIYTGFIEDVSEEDFIISCISPLGNEEGKSLFKTNEISGIHLDDIDDRNRFSLYNWKKEALK